MQKNKKIIMACTHHLNSSYKVGSHHIYSFLKKNNYDVLYISAPLTPFHLLRSSNPDIKVRWALKAKSNLELVPFSLVAPDATFPLNSKLVLNYWLKTNFGSLKQTLKQLDFIDVDAIYVDNIFYHGLLDLIRPQKILFRVMDFHPGFPGWEGKVKGIASKIARKADVTFYTATGLLRYIEGLGAKKAEYLPNGIDLSLFNIMEQDKVTLKIPFSDSKSPKVVYVGSLDKWMDWSLIERMAKVLPNFIFDFYGPITNVHIPDQVKGLNNLTFKGVIKHSELPTLFRAYDIGIIPFDTINYKALVENINPLKLYEYMAAGLPVVSMHWPEIENIHSKIHLAESAEQFIHQLKSVADNLNNNEEKKSYVPASKEWNFILQKLLNELTD
jgi:glycosyltransferase involved in cell wall biosynthesis